MILELHDTEVGKTLTATIRNISFDYQAEQYVLDTYAYPMAESVVKWILIDDEGDRCVWERPAGSSHIPEITSRATRFQGRWQRGSNESVLPL